MKDIKRIAVVGAGLMGHSIAQTFGQAGKQVVLYDLSEQILRQAIDGIECNLRELADWGLLSPSDIQPILNRFQMTTVLEHAVSDADVVVEAVFEDLELKKRIFKELDRFCPECTILASNASGFIPSEYASATNRADRVVGTHYFSPAHLIPLVEIVRSKSTSDATVETIYKLLKTTGKLPVIVQKETPGFIANRLQAALQREAFYIIDQGIASPQDIDIAVKASFGLRLPFVGQFEHLEMYADYEMVLKVFNYIIPDLCSSKQPPPVLMDKVKNGELGGKTGKGFYDWTPESLEARRKQLRESLLKFFHYNRLNGWSKKS
jgi:3-hydroxybutyryl-CoA dehydrogenase